MTWTKYPVNTFAIEADPIDAAVAMQVIRGNPNHLARQPPACGGRYVLTADRVAIASGLWYRGGFRQVRAAVDQPLRNIEVRIRGFFSVIEPNPPESPPGTFANVTWYAQATRFWTPQGASGGTHVYVADDLWLSAIHGYGSATSPVERTITLPMQEPYAPTTQYGSGGDGRGDAWYYQTRIRVGLVGVDTDQASVGGVTLVDLAWQEVDP